MPSVGHAAMDEDHAEIEAAMRGLLATFEEGAARVLVTRFATHARREELLLASAGFGEDGGKGTLAGKSASHAADHAAIVRLGEKMLEDAAGEDAAGDTIVDDDRFPRATRRGIVDEASAERLCRRIVEHAATFDALYAFESLGP
jgi:hypothetical protein